MNALAIKEEDYNKIMELFEKFEGCTKFKLNDQVIKTHQDEESMHSIGSVGIIKGGILTQEKEFYLVLFNGDTNNTFIMGDKIDLI